jgi:GT2 family glycosyltransferase
VRRVAVIIPSWNGRHLLGWCLEAVRRQDEADLEVVVVDNGSSDDTAAWLATERPDVRVLGMSVNRGFAEAVNAGIAATSAPYLLVLNNDAAPEPAYARRLADELDARPRAAACQGRILRHDDPSIVDSLGIGLDRRLCASALGHGGRDPGPGEPREVIGVSATAALYRRRALDEAADPGRPPAIFDPQFFAYYEDVDLALRLEAIGWSSWLVPEVACEHVGSATGVEGSSRKAFLLGRNFILYLTRHRARIGLAAVALAVITRLSRRGLTFILHPRRDLALTAGEIAALRHVPRAWVKGKRIQAASTATGRRRAAPP